VIINDIHQKVQWLAGKLMKKGILPSKRVYRIREQQNKPWSDIIPIGKILHRCSVWASSESPHGSGGNLKKKIELPPSAAGGAFIYLNAASMPLH
jgi:hypothetical protein